jgi:hypothetical protein
MNGAVIGIAKTITAKVQNEIHRDRVEEVIVSFAAAPGTTMPASVGFASVTRINRLPGTSTSGSAVPGANSMGQIFPPQ